jgi:hypothetical protein
MRYRLRTLLIVLAVAPPILAGLWLAGVWLATDGRYWGLLGVVLGFAAYIASMTLAVWSYGWWMGSNR